MCTVDYKGATVGVRKQISCKDPVSNGDSFNQVAMELGKKGMGSKKLRRIVKSSQATSCED